MALPVFLDVYVGWNYMQIGLYLGAWVIGYGVIQALAPTIRHLGRQQHSPNSKTIQFWNALL